MADLKTDLPVAFEHELVDLIQEHNIDIYCNTNDVVLARYLMHTLVAIKNVKYAEELDKTND